MHALGFDGVPVFQGADDNARQSECIFYFRIAENYLHHRLINTSNRMAWQHSKHSSFKCIHFRCFFFTFLLYVRRKLASSCRKFPRNSSTIASLWIALLVFVNWYWCLLLPCSDHLKIVSLRISYIERQYPTNPTSFAFHTHERYIWWSHITSLYFCYLKANVVRNSKKFHE